MKFSIIIPARDESASIGACLDSIGAASAAYFGDAEVIVVLNRCTDNTGEIALARGARTVSEDSRNLAKVRNAGARTAKGEIIVTVDADSTISPNMLKEIDKALGSGKYIGGGVPVIPERKSLGIVLTGLLIVSIVPLGISGGLFWCRRADFEAVGGFNESMIVAEDVDFAVRLREHGRKNGKRFGTLWRTWIKTSCRKFDKFGDWFLIKRPWLLWRAVRGNDSGMANAMFYDFERKG